MRKGRERDIRRGDVERKREIQEEKRGGEEDGMHEERGGKWKNEIHEERRWRGRERYRKRGEMERKREIQEEMERKRGMHEERRGGDDGKDT